MNVGRWQRAAFAGGLLTAWVLATAAAGAAPPAAPSGQISNVKKHIGVIQFVLSAGGLPSGSTLDPKSITVEANGTTLDATASRADAATTPRATPIREVVLALDVSGSMQGDGITAARAAARAYAKNLPADVRVGLVTFADSPALVLPPTRDRTRLLQAIDRVKAGGGTALFDGVVTAAALMRGLPASADGRLLVLSDGDDTSSKHKIADATAALSREKVAADVVGFRLPGDQTVLRQLASASGGQVLPAGNAGDLAGAFTALARAFQQQILVTVRVPREFALKQVAVVAAVNAGTLSVTAHAGVTMPDAASGPAAKPLSVSSPAVATSDTGLWVLTAGVFVALLVLALVALFLPVMNEERARKASRLSEVHRYRVVGVVGSNELTPSLLPASSAPTAFTTRTLSLVERGVRARGQKERLTGQLELAGLRMRPEEWAALQLLSVAMPAILFGFLAGSIIGAVIGAAGGYLAVWYFMRLRISRRADAFSDQLPDTLQLLAGSLQTGFSLAQALAGVVREGTEPTASEFSRALTEMRLGVDLEEALDGVADRMDSDDLRLVIMALRISREVGGNLAEVLRTTVSTMRERAELRGQVKVLSAEGRISAKVLIGLPFLLAAYLLVFKKGYLDPLVTTGPGIALLVTGGVLLAIGSFWINRVVKIEV